MKSGELFIAALRKCGGIIAEGETPEAPLMEDTRVAFNILLDSWSAERLSVFATQDQEFTWPSGAASRTIGPSGDLTGLRPVRVEDSSYFLDSGTNISYQITEVNEEQYNSIVLKTSTSSFPQVCWVNPTVPNSVITVYPIPNQALQLHLVSVEELVQVDDLVTDIIMPPGYLRALTYNLACEIAPELGVEPPPTTQRLAMTSKRVLKAVNSPKDVMGFLPALTGRRRGFNIYSGGC